MQQKKLFKEQQEVWALRLRVNNMSKKDKVKLIWILSFLSFFFSAVLDNLTTAIIMAALLPKLIKNK